MYNKNEGYKKILAKIVDIKEDVEDPYTKDKLDNLTELIKEMYNYMEIIEKDFLCQVKDCRWRLYW